MNVAGVAEDDRGAQRSDAVDLDERRARRERRLRRSVRSTRRAGCRSRRTSPSRSVASRLRSMSTSSTGANRAKDLGGSSCGEPPLGAARDHRAQQRVEPADRLGAQRGQVVVTIREQSQHRGVIDRRRPHAATGGASRRSPRRGRRAGRTCRCAPCPTAAPAPTTPVGRRRRSRRPRRAAAPTTHRAPTPIRSPRSRCERRGERQQPVALTTVRGDPQLADHPLGAVEHRRGV